MEIQTGRVMVCTQSPSTFLRVKSKNRFHISRLLTGSRVCCGGQLVGHSIVHIKIKLQIIRYCERFNVNTEQHPFSSSLFQRSRCISTFLPFHFHCVKLRVVTHLTSERTKENFTIATVQQIWILRLFNHCQQIAAVHTLTHAHGSILDRDLLSPFHTHTDTHRHPSRVIATNTQ